MFTANLSFTVLQQWTSVPEKNFQTLNENTNPKFSLFLELFFYLTTIICFIFIRVSSSLGCPDYACLAVWKKHFLALHSLSFGPEATAALTLLMLPPTVAKVSGFSVSLTFLLIFREVSYLFKDDLLKPNEQSRNVRSHRVSSFICKICILR